MPRRVEKLPSTVYVVEWDKPKDDGRYGYGALSGPYSTLAAAKAVIANVLRRRRTWRTDVPDFGGRILKLVGEGHWVEVDYDGK